MDNKEKVNQWAKLFNALGSTQRLDVYLALIEVLPNGFNLKELQEKLDMKPSTLAHHIKFLTEANLVYQEKQSKETINFANNNTLNDLCISVMDRCCK